VTQHLSPGASTTRRDFLTASATGAAAFALAGLTPAVHAAGSDTLKVALIGCGGRGTGAATQALHADPNLKLTAVGDAFPDRIETCLKQLKSDGDIADKIDVQPDRRFTGFDAYKQVLASGVDVVLLATPPHFRPIHLKAAVDAGKHIFCEKPVAVDAPGAHAVFEACREAKKKNLALVSGLCWRYHHGKRETMKRVHDGAVGEIIALHTNYNVHGLWHKNREPAMSDMEWQLRNWLYFTWLSGDHIVEQHIHSLDKMAWAMKDEPPVKAFGHGGRQSRTQPEFGQIFDHHAVCFEYANGVKLFSYCRQQDGTPNDVSDYILGTAGTCDVMKHAISPRHPTGTAWRYKASKGDRDDMYQNEHDELFASIRAGKPINDGEWMTKSTLLAIMGRMATYTGQMITWEQVLNSKQNLSPAKYEFGSLPTAEVARPGITKFA
jgi:myo-inositol 2-dehydrogenase / D-chiro-inositol 1-dehydrogenase